MIFMGDKAENWPSNRHDRNGSKQESGIHPSDVLFVVIKIELAADLTRKSTTDPSVFDDAWTHSPALAHLPVEEIIYVYIIYGAGDNLGV